MPENQINASLFTVLQIIWSYLWARKHLVIRKGRRYSESKELTSSDPIYRKVSPIMFLMQVGLSIACFWCSSPALLLFHSSPTIRGLGFGILFAAMHLYFVALKELGANYSPCYDLHLPNHLTTTGPYAFIRHPMYLAKIMIGVGTLLIAGSYWFLPTTAYLVVATLRSASIEETRMVEVPGFIRYQKQTKCMLPFLF